MELTDGPHDAVGDEREVWEGRQISARLAPVHYPGCFEGGRLQAYGVWISVPVSAVITERCV